jgi:methyl-accepting chemotaxis protein
MVARQQDNLKTDGAAVLAETSFLTTLLWVLMGVGRGGPPSSMCRQA